MRFATLLMVPLLVLGTQAHGQEATFTPLGSPPGGFFFSFATGVSGDGRVVVGQAGGANPGAFRWEDGVMETLDDPPWGAPVIAWATSADGAILIGFASIPPDGDREAFRWEDGVLEGLGDLPGGEIDSEAYDVSFDGAVVVGSSQSANGTDAFRWEEGVMEALPELPGGDYGSIAHAVSSDGAIVGGFSHGSNGLEAVRWVDGAVEGLGFPPGGHTTYMYDMSADGTVVVGRVFVSNPSGTVGFIWRKGVGMEYIPDLPGGSPYREAIAVSGDGRVVVGPADGPSGFETFIWTEEMGIRSFRDMLETLGVDLTGWFLGGVLRHGVSYDGTVIVGNGTNPNGDQEGWRVELPPFPVANAPEEPEPSEFRVSVHPNPVRDRATFRFSIPEETRVTLKIYDVLGREVMTVFDADHEAGSATLLWNPADHSGRPMPNGVYVYRLTLADLIYTGAVTVLN